MVPEKIGNVVDFLLWKLVEVFKLFQISACMLFLQKSIFKVKIFEALQLANPN